MRRDSDLARINRAVKHAKHQDFRKLTKQLTEKGG